RIEITTLFSERRLLDLINDAVDDLSGSIHITDDAADGFHDLAQIRWPRVQKILGRTGIVARGRNGLPHLMSQRGGQLPHHAHSVHVRQIGLKLTGCLFPRLRSVKSSTNATPSLPLSLKSAIPISTGTRLPSFRKYSFS